MESNIKEFIYPFLAKETPESAVSIAAKELMREGESANTRRSYRGALMYWAAWHRLRFAAELSLPISVSCVLQFIVDHARRTTPAGMLCELPKEMDEALVKAGVKGANGPVALSTLMHRISVMSKLHQLHAGFNPCHDPRVRELILHTRKAYAKRGDVPKKKDALTKDPLYAVLATCDETLRGRRDRALLLFAWASGGRRRSEVAAADIRFLSRVAEGGYSYELVHSKTNQSGAERPENHKPILGIAGAALQDWLSVSNIVEGPIFRRILKGGRLGGRLTAGAVGGIVKARCEQAGLAGAYSAHSLRSGFMTEAAMQNVSLADTMAMTGHKSVAVALGYHKRAAMTRSPAATLL